MQKLPGVSSVKVSLNEGLTVLDLKPDNSVTLAGLRQVIRNNGFVTNESRVVVRGRLVPSAGGLVLEVANSREKLLLPAAANAAAFDQLRNRAQSSAVATVEISGSVDTKNPNAMVLSVTGIESP